MVNVYASWTHGDLSPFHCILIYKSHDGIGQDQSNTGFDWLKNVFQL